MSLSGAPGVPARPSPVWTGETPVAPSCHFISRSTYSLYTKPATTAAKIEPIHRSSIHPSGNMVGTADHVAGPKLPGTPAQNPTIIPILRAVFGPGPAVARAHA